MKKFLVVFVTLLLCGSIISCKEEKISGELSGLLGSESAAVTEGWSVTTKMTCKVHHFDYHVLPYDLVMHVGIDEVNAWMAECEKSSDADAECPFAPCNIKSFIEKFHISPETFVLKADLVHFATYDAARLYAQSAEEAEEYFSHVATLRDESIKAQHFGFLENYFIGEHTDVVMKLITIDESGERSPSPSMAEMVQAVGLSRSEFEKLIGDIDKKTLDVCGKLLRYDYDLGVIYNEDGSYKELPNFEGLTRAESIQKYDNLFCRR